MTRYEAYVLKDWEQTGMAFLVVARFRNESSADYGIFLVDLLCLGLKDTFGERDLSASEAREIIEERLPEDERESIHPTCAKKLIEGAIAFAQRFGFAPHRDFRKSRKALSGLDASLCPTEFTYGKDGKPCYIRSPGDDDDRVDRILRVLEARCGPDGFIFDDPLMGDETDEDDLVELRQELLEWLENEPPEIPRFYELSGMMTALIICPQAISPNDLIDEFWRPDKREWQDQDELLQFLRLFMEYWNHLSGLVADCTDPDSPPQLHPVDIWVEDFDDHPPETIAIASHAWAVGFDRATKLQPEAWAEARSRPDLAPHWELLNWWAHFEKGENRKAIADAGDADSSRNMANAVTALARALHQS